MDGSSHHPPEPLRHPRHQLVELLSPANGSIPFAGVFFSTFFGGHETSWGPKKEVHAYFSNFKVGTTKL